MGSFITFEGIEGSGKSTQIRLLFEHLKARDIEARMTREPGGTIIGEKVRGILLDPATKGLIPRAELFLYAAARLQHIEEVIQPGMDEGKVVLCDRFMDATVAYQGYGQGMDVQTIRELNVLATGGVLPDLTLVLDLDPVAGMRRIRGRALDAFEKMDSAFHRRVREGYLEIARADKNRVVVLDADRDPDALHADVVRAVDELLARRGGLRGA